MDFSIFTDFTTRFISIVVTAVPLLILGVFVFALMEQFLPLGAVWLPRRKYLSIPLASLAGAVVPVCDCGAIPVAHGMSRRGAGLGESLSFVVGAPVINPIVFLTTAAVFGPLAAAGRLAATFLIALIVGAFFTYYYADKGKPAADIQGSVEIERDPNLNPDGSVTAIPSGGAATLVAARSSILTQINAVITHASEELVNLGRFVILGAAVAAGIQTVVPQDQLASIASNNLLAVLLLMILAFVLSLCSLSDAPIAATFVGNFGPGAVLAFMVFGQIIDLKNVFMMLATFKQRVTLTFVAVSTVAVLLLGIFVNILVR